MAPWLVKFVTARSTRSLLVLDYCPVADLALLYQDFYQSRASYPSFWTADMHRGIRWSKRLGSGELVTSLALPALWTSKDQLLRAKCQDREGSSILHGKRSHSGGGSLHAPHFEGCWRCHGGGLPWNLAPIVQSEAR